MLLFLIDLINIEKLRISFRFFYLLSFLILLFFVAELHHIVMESWNIYLEIYDFVGNGSKK